MFLRNSCTNNMIWDSFKLKTNLGDQYKDKILNINTTVLYDTCNLSKSNLGWDRNNIESTINTDQTKVRIGLF